jgi:CBS domain containing-hemolysin-like protein/mannitol/fructose-specific phosphotransferase system IIA component
VLAVLLIALLAMLGLNGFFVLAEFAIVRVRPSRVDELIAAGETRAATLADIQQHLDEHLGVCQVGITLASIGLGMVGEETAKLITGEHTSSFGRTVIAVAVSYIVISGAHIVLAELVPKSIAIRIADRAALWSTPPLRFFRRLFFPALWVLNTLANLTVRALHLPPADREQQHSEAELRIILEHFQERGLLSFRRLLYLENVFDLGGLTVRDAMRPRAQVRCLDARAPWPENLAVIRAAHYSRYPLLAGDPERPVGFVHLKDVVIRGGAGQPDLRALARPMLGTTETTPLEAILAEMQRKHIQAALVRDAEGRWTGLVTLEDVIEELVGTIRDEFEDEEPVRLSEALSVDRIQLDVEADSPTAAVRAAVARMKADALPLPAELIIHAVDERERLAGTYLGHGIGLPHARLAGIAKPFALIVRSNRGIACRGTAEKAHLLFVLLTPAGQPRVHQRLQSIIATLLHESAYVKDRLHTASSPAEILEAIRAGEQASLD